MLQGEREDVSGLPWTDDQGEPPCGAEDKLHPRGELGSGEASAEMSGGGLSDAVDGRMDNVDLRKP